MFSLIAILISSLFVIIMITGCTKTADQPPPQQQAPMQSPMAKPSDIAGGSAPAHAPSPMQAAPAAPKDSVHGAINKKEKTVAVPDDVKKTWKKVKLVLKDNKTGKTKELVAALGSTLEIPEAGLTVKVGEFLPLFNMSGDTITSRGNEPTNPAVRVEVTEKGKSIFKGWLFAAMPDVHPFEHPKYGLTLKEGLKQ